MRGRNDRDAGPVRWALAAALALGFASRAAAAEPAAPGTASPAPVSPKRAVPDYDGRGRPPATAADAVLWIPRVVLAPAYVVSEYVLRAPLSAAVPAAERADLPRKVYDLFTFGPEHKAGFVPVGFVEFNFNPSVGVYAFWNDAGFTGNHLHAHVEAWPSDWFAGNVVEHIDMRGRRDLQLRLSGVRRPDKVFNGLGPRSLQADQSRYGLQQVEGSAAYEWRFWRSSRIAPTAGVRDLATYDGQYGTDLSITATAARGAFAVPYGFGKPYTIEYNQLVASIDSRESRARPSRGAYVELGAEQNSSLRSSPATGWIRYGASAGAYVDVNGYGRIVGLSAGAAFVDPLSVEPVPFTELVYLGGDHPMPGYYDGRLRDRSAATATASYAWPIGPWLNGDVEIATGDVFGEHLAGFEPKLLRLSGAFGLTLVGARDSAMQDAPLELLIGFGTETFEHGTQPDSVRVMLGTPHSF
jgi:hypothetical protein